MEERVVAVAHLTVTTGATSKVSGTPTVGYSYDPDGLLTNAGAASVQRAVTTGAAEQITVDQVVTGQQFDGDRRLAQLTHNVSGIPTLGFSYTYDVLDRVATKTETTPTGSVTFGYTYTAAGQLWKVYRDGVVWREYTYDANGNRTSDQVGGQLAVSSVFDAQDRQTSRGSTPYTYSHAGEVAQAGTGAAATSYERNATGQLVGVTLPSGVQIGYDLDAQGRIVTVRRDGVVQRRYLYGLEAIGPVARLNADQTVYERYVYGTRNHVPDYLIRDGVTYRLITDELGSVRRVVNAATGTVAQAIDYDPYGNVLADTQPGFQPFGYTGGVTDVDTGLVRLGARDYDPTLGRWTTKDPIGFAGGDPNLYAYVAGDPINAIDPTGLILDTIADVAFIAYDLYSIADSFMDGCGLTDTDLAALGADVALALIPFGTGGGPAIRGAKGADGGSAAPAPSSAPGSRGGESSPTAPFGPPGPDFEWRGPRESGSWFNPKTNEYLRPDPSHPRPQGPHWDYRAPDGGLWRLYPNGQVEQKRLR